MNSKASYINLSISSVLNHISEALLIENADQTIIFLNKRFCYLLNIKEEPDSFIGKATSSLHPFFSFNIINFDKFIADTDATIVNQKDVLNYEIELLNSQLVLRDYHLIREEDNICHLWIYKDYSTYQDKLRNNDVEQSFLEKVLSGIPADIAILNKDLRYLFLNRNIIENDEIRKWVIGKTDEELHAFADKATSANKLRINLLNKVFKTATHVEFEEEVFDKKHKREIYLRRYVPFSNLDGNIEFVVSFGSNITNLKNKENQLKKSEENYLNLLRNLNEIALTIDAGNSITFINPIWEEIMGFSMEETIGYPLENFFEPAAHSELFELIKNFRGDTVDTQTSAQKEYLVNNKFGRKKYLQFNITGNKFDGNTSDQIIIFITDITEVYQAEIQLKNIIKKEKNLNDLKSSFVTMVSHELRTPLAIIQSTVELMELHHLKSKLTAEALMGSLGSIKEETFRMTEIMNELLTLSQIEESNIKFKPQLINIEEFIGDLLEVNYQPWKDGRKLNYIFRGLSEKIWIDEFSLTMIIINIVENAFKYSPGKQPPVMRVTCTNKGWSILVADEGIGMSLKDKKTIFSSFKRGSNVGSIPGTGMGLVVVKYLLENYNAYVNIRSRLNSGTYVYISFPYYKKPD
jgi:PAS domain S-box-containing protein